MDDGNILKGLSTCFYTVETDFLLTVENYDFSYGITVENPFYWKKSLKKNVHLWRNEYERINEKYDSCSHAHRLYDSVSKKAR